jgi:hypothetical protein
VALVRLLLAENPKLAVLRSRFEDMLRRSGHALARRGDELS